MREAHPQPIALLAAAMAAGHIHCCPRHINKYEMLRLQIQLFVEQMLPLFQDVGTVLLHCVTSLFL